MLHSFDHYLANCGILPQSGEEFHMILRNIYLHVMKQLGCILLLIHFQVHAQNFTQYVNPFIGTGGHGHTYPGATMPFGFVQLSPDTRPDGYNDWDGCGGYHYSDSIIYGFSHTHLSGTGVPDYCDVLLIPTVGVPVLTNISGNDPSKGYASAFSHKTEKASPGYYAVLLEDDSIPVELTTTARVGLHKYLFPNTTQANIILDLMHRDKLVEGSYIEIISPTKVQGLRRSSSWAKDQWLYFAIEFSQPFIKSGIVNGALTVKNQIPSIVSGTELKSYFQFSTDGATPLYVKCALSPVSCAGAWNNMRTEMPGWDFEQVKKNAEDTWNKELSKIEVTSNADAKKDLRDTTNKLVIFYSALYHCMLAPNIYEDVDGKYRGRDNKIHVAEGFDYYTVFSLWDTYRALHPLLTIIDQKRTADFINTFLKQYEQGGRLPVWELSSNETDCMIGYHSVSVIADAAAKGIKGFDYDKAYEAMKHSANLDIFGLKYYKEKGFIESNEEPESVSKTLEYSYDDWCIGMMAYNAGAHSNEMNYYFKRGDNFRNVYRNGFMQPRINGGWYSPFDPTEVNFNYTEANAWQYAFFAPQQSGKLFEDSRAYETALDSLFETKAKMSGREQSDISGLIGQYAHGNEPSHHIAYLYNFTNAPWKTQHYTNKIINDFYKNTTDGLIGNEDCGQMSAWYVLSAMGIYQVCPGYINFSVTAPIFDSSSIHLENGKSFNMHVAGDVAPKKYIAEIARNGKNELNPHLSYNAIMMGQTLSFTLSETPNQQLQPEKGAVNIQSITPAPVLSTASGSFIDSLNITSDLGNDSMYLFISLDGKDPIGNSYRVDKLKIIDHVYSFYITNTSEVRACLVNSNNNKQSSVIKGHYTKLPHRYSIHYLNQYNPQYTAGGDAALIDGLHGGTDFRTGMWQGWQGGNMEVVLDLGEKTEIKKAGAGFLQDVRSWIWMPTKLDIYISDDGKNYTLLTTIQQTVADDNYDSKEITDMITEFSPVKTRYVKFVATNFGTVPEWHPGKGGQSWVFCDEVWVE